MSAVTVFLVSQFLIIYLWIFESQCNVITVNKENEYFRLSVIHFNDFHSRFEETDVTGFRCKNKSECIGGYSRLYSQIKAMKKSNPDSIVLNAGDVFYGTFWHTIGGWNISQEFMNKLPIDASVLGNHEFDSSIEGVIPYIKALKHPIVVSNMDHSHEPLFQGIYTKSHVIERGGKKIGIIGLVASNFNKIAKTRNLTFHPASPSVNEEAERLVKEGVFTNIVVGHAGYSVDKEVAANASRKICLIVGGHSHSFLSGEDRIPIPDTVVGRYPTLVRSKFGHKVAIVHAASFCRILGNITIFLNENGDLGGYSGNPIYLDRKVPEDLEINKNLLKWKQYIELQGNIIVGSTEVDLDHTKCPFEECSLGDVVTDSMLDYFSTKLKKQNSSVYDMIAVISTGGLRSSIQKGNITYEYLNKAIPFRDTIEMGEIQGQYIKDLFESTLLAPTTYHSRLLQVSGAKVTYNMTHPPGEKVVSIKVLSQNSKEEAFKELDINRTYNLVVPYFLKMGGDNFDIIPIHLKNVKVGPLDINILKEYIKNNSPKHKGIHDRLIFI